jgi:hypothetical protein
MADANKHPDEAGRHKKHGNMMMRWLLISGGVGVLVAILLGIFTPKNPLLLIVLVPFSFLALAEPTSSSHEITLTLIVLGTNFILYGALGVFLRQRFRRRPVRQL